MKKYYVSSGDVRWTLLAKGPNAAANRFINLALKPAFTQGKQDVADYQMVDWKQAQKLIALFDKRITVSEQGFFPKEFNSYPTNNCLEKWQQQIQAIEKMIRKSK